MIEFKPSKTVAENEPTKMWRYDVIAYLDISPTKSMTLCVYKNLVQYIMELFVHFRTTSSQRIVEWT
jgi:hypothetical protein